MFFEKLLNKPSTHNIAIENNTPPRRISSGRPCDLPGFATALRNAMIDELPINSKNAVKAVAMIIGITFFINISFHLLKILKITTTIASSVNIAITN